MRSVTKTISIPVEGKPLDFRLTKLDAFSGVMLLRMLSKAEQAEQGEQGAQATVRPAFGSGPARSADAEPQDCPRRSFAFDLLLSSLSDADLRSLMTACLEHAEVSLPAGWHPVMTRGEWTYPELEHDTAACLRLTIEEVLWTLDGFFGGGASDSPPGTPAT